MLYLGNNPIAGLNKPLAVRNVGEIVQSTLPLTDAGLHLLDGSLILGGGIYQGFVDYIAELYDNTSVSGYKLNVNVTGSVTNNNGVLSNFSTSNYAKIPSNFQPGSNPWEIMLKVTTGAINSSWQHLLAFQKGLTNAERYATRISITNNNKFGLTLSYNGTAWDVPGETTGQGTYTVLPNTTYYLRVEYTGSAYKLSYSLDGETFVQDCFVTSSTPIYNSNTSYLLGVWNNGSFVEPWLGSIDLKESYININGSRWWTGAEAIKPCFCTETEWQTSVTTYGSCGKFVYDSTNNTVRLPKVSDILQGTTDLTALGNLIEAGLPNITGLVGQTGYDLQPSGAFSSSRMIGGYSTGQFGFNYTNFDASRSSSIYGNNTTVQPQTIKTLLYIVIATSTKTDIQVDIDEIATDLNGKADVDLTNVNDSAKVMMSGMGMPSDKYINLTLGASGTKYTAPADGWVLVGKRCTANQYLGTYANTIMKCLEVWNSSYCSLYFPVKKGDIFPISYTAAGTTEVFRFIYAEGSASEVN